MGKRNRCVLTCKLSIIKNVQPWVVVHILSWTNTPFPLKDAFFLLFSFAVWTYFSNRRDKQKSNLCGSTGPYCRLKVFNMLHVGRRLSHKPGFCSCRSFVIVSVQLVSKSLSNRSFYSLMSWKPYYVYSMFVLLLFPGGFSSPAE